MVMNDVLAACDAILRHVAREGMVVGIWNSWCEGLYQFA